MNLFPPTDQFIVVDMPGRKPGEHIEKILPPCAHGMTPIQRITRLETFLTFVVKDKRDYAKRQHARYKAEIEVLRNL